MKKILIIIVILLALGLAVKLALKPKFANGPQQTPDQLTGVDTSEWKIYQNKDYSFYLNYPASINLIEGSNGVVLQLDDYLAVPTSLKEDFGELIRGEEGYPTNLISVSFSTYAFDNPEDYPIGEWLQFYFEDEYKAADMRSEKNFNRPLRKVPHSSSKL
jgi:hypothetical protein